MACHKMIKFDSENPKGECPGSLTGDASTATQGLIILQEWWGMNEQIKQQAADIAQQSGFVTLVPDLYRGSVTMDFEEAGHLMHGLDWAGAVKDIQGAARYLLASGCTKVGVTGFCMGGALSLAAAALVPEITASAPFYGIPKPSLCDVTTIKIPVQLHFAEYDKVEGFSSPKDVQKLVEQFKAAGVNYELNMYDCDHGFNHVGSDHYSEKHSKMALQNMINFMRENC